jgi:hypothetical protein
MIPEILFKSRTKNPTKGQAALIATATAATLAIAFGAIRLLTVPAASPTVWASDGTAASVQFLHDNSAQDGDTITLPAGVFTWSTSVNITKAVTIQGRTTLNSYTGICSDQTILQDNIPANPGTGLFECTTNAGQFLRITGLTIRNAPGNAVERLSGVINLHGTSHTVRLDHLHLTDIGSVNGITVAGNIYGVADHIVEDNLQQGKGLNRVDNGGAPYGDLVWSQPANYGGLDFWFLEDWYINNTQNGVNSASGGVDSHTGGKFVVRHCHIYDAQFLCHGTEGGRGRSGRAQEYYNNYYHYDSAVDLFGLRGGTMVAHDNTFDGGKPTGYGLQTYRTFYGWGVPFHAADGSSGWDYNVTESDGVTHIDGHRPYLFESGTLTASSGDFCCPWTVTDASKNWAPNRFKGYEIRRTSDGATAQIDGNTNNTLQIFQWQSQHFAAGDSYWIRKPLMAIDQPGLGAGDLLSGDAPTNRWLNQIREGCWSWNNIYTPDGSHINFNLGRNAGANGQLVEGLDYHSDTPLSGYVSAVYPHPLVSGLAPSPTPTP